MSSILKSKSKHRPIAIEMSNVTTVSMDDAFAKVRVGPYVNAMCISLGLSVKLVSVVR